MSAALEEGEIMNRRPFLVENIYVGLLLFMLGILFILVAFHLKDTHTNGWLYFVFASVGAVIAGLLNLYINIRKRNNVKR